MSERLTENEKQELAEVDALAEHFRTFGTYDGFEGFTEPDDHPDRELSDEERARRMS